VTHVITQPCCNDASCVPVCPVNCIHPTPDEPDYAFAEMLYIDPDSCIDCGACVTKCPVDAIVADYDLDDDAAPFLDINARWFADPAHQGYPSTPASVGKPRLEVEEPGPLRVAVVGAGPAGVYAAEELLARRGLEAEVHLFEKLPVPWGLVRFGVAPDHQSTKAVTSLFARTASRPGLRFHLNVEIGNHLSHEELLAHHHAVIYTTGAPRDRRLGISGEELPGSHSATDFVAWYNGHPDFVDHAFDLSGERAVVVGTGNVALDVARVLVSDVADLARTDIADHALEALADSRIREVMVLGRRGPEHGAFTTAELVGLSSYDVGVADADALMGEGLKLDLLRQLVADSPTRAKQILFRFLTSPVEVLGTGEVQGLRVVRNELVEGLPVPTDEIEELECGLVLRSIGYRGVALPGLPFDEAGGVVPNVEGRVTDPATGAPVPGVYTAGWIKRGPSGVIGTNKRCASQTVELLLADYRDGRLERPSAGGAELTDLLELRQPTAFGYAGWKAIDAHEVAAGRERRRPRTKLVRVPDMLDVAVGARQPG